jgi:hypothetical protein
VIIILLLWWSLAAGNRVVPSRWQATRGFLRRRHVTAVIAPMSRHAVRAARLCGGGRVKLAVALAALRTLKSAATRKTHDRSRWCPTVTAATPYR